MTSSPGSGCTGPSRATKSTTCTWDHVSDWTLLPNIDFVFESIFCIYSVVCHMRLSHLFSLLLLQYYFPWKSDETFCTCSGYLVDCYGMKGDMVWSYNEVRCCRCNFYVERTALTNITDGPIALIFHQLCRIGGEGEYFMPPSLPKWMRNCCWARYDSC